MWNGRNFQPRQDPIDQNRLGRHLVGNSPILIGAPCVIDPTGGPEGDGDDGNGSSVMKLAVGPQAPGALSGICYWEAAYDGVRGMGAYDPVLLQDADIAFAPPGVQIQVWRGREVRISYTNTPEVTVGPGMDGLGNTYAARNMIAPGAFGATPDIKKTALLTPHASPSDANGYFQVTTDRSLAWLEVTSFDLDIFEVTVQSLF